MRKAGKTTAFAAGALLVLGLGGCGSKEPAASEQATAEPAPGAAGQPGGMATASAGASQAIGSYLGESGADPTGRTFALDRISFDSGSATLDAADQQVLGEVAAVLRQHPDAAVTVTSHVEAGGDAAANKKLAAARAVAVKNALSAAGAPAGKLMTDVVDTGGAAPVGLLVKRG